MRAGFSVDPYLSKIYRKKIYTCIEFSRDVWLDATGEDLADRLPILAVRSEDRRIVPANLRKFERLSKPQSPCIVVMRRPRVVPHMGIYMRGRILQLTQAGASFLSPNFACLGFKTVCFYK